MASNNQERRELAMTLYNTLLGVRVHNHPRSEKYFNEFRDSGRTELLNMEDEKALKRVIAILREDIGLPVSIEESNWSDATITR